MKIDKCPCCECKLNFYIKEDGTSHLNCSSNYSICSFINADFKNNILGMKIGLINQNHRYYINYGLFVKDYYEYNVRFVYKDEQIYYFNINPYLQDINNMYNILFHVFKDKIDKLGLLE